MTDPRPVLDDRTYMITRRCAERRFFLRPDDQVDQAFAYCFGVAAKRHGIDVYWLSVMSNHYHDGVHDNEGKYPKFLQYFHSLLARCLNVHLGRWESFWSAEQTCALLLDGGDTVFDKMVYSLTNPAKDHLVDRVMNWPGLNSLRYQLADKPMVVKRPEWFFAPDGDMPDEVTLTFVRPPEFAHLSQEEWADKLRTAVAAVERKAAAERKASGRKIVGRKAILRQSPYSCPKSHKPRRGLRPRVAARNKWRRIELLQANKAFIARYKKCLEARRAGVPEVDVAFPHGTYKLRLLGLVHCEAPVQSSPGLARCDAAPQSAPASALE